MKKIISWLPNLTFTKQALKIIAPTMAAYFLITMTNIVDNTMVGRTVFGENALPAVAIANEIIYLFFSFLFGISIICDTFSSQFFGAKKEDKFKEVLKIQFLFGFSISLFFVLIANLFGTQIISLFLSSNSSPKEDMENIIHIGSTYLKWVVWGMLFFSFISTFNGSLAIIGYPNYHLFAAILSLLSNILFNYIFIFILNLNVIGAAVSTIISRTLEFFLMSFFVYIHRKKLWFSFRRMFLIDFKLLWILSKRWLIILGQVSIAFGFIAQTAVWSIIYGTTELKALAVTYTIGGVIFTIIPGIATSVKIMIGSKLGANKLEEAYDDSKKLFKLIIIIAILVASLSLPLSFFFPQLMGISGPAVDLAKWTILIFCVSSIFFAIETYCFSCLETGGFTRASTFFDKFFVLIAVTPFTFVLSYFTPLSFVLTFLITFIFHTSFTCLIGFFIFFRKKWLRNITKEAEVQIEKVIGE